MKRSGHPLPSEEITETLTLNTLNQTMDNLLVNRQFQEYVQNVAHNPLVTHIRTQIAFISGEQLAKTYGKREVLILMTLFAGAVAAGIGSLTFLVGKQFPSVFSSFANLPISPIVSENLGDFLAWANVAIEAIFYTWTISGLLPQLQPKEIDKQAPMPVGEIHNFRHYSARMVSFLPRLGEWGLALASALPLTLLSLIDQDKNDTSAGLKYSILASIALVTVVSNKYFLTLTHHQFKKVGMWLRSNTERDKIKSYNNDLLAQTKNAFIEAVHRASIAPAHLASHQEVHNLITDLKNVVHTPVDLRDNEAQVGDERWKNLLAYALQELSFTAPVVNKIAVFLVPFLAIFAALSWLGLIATVPQGMAETLGVSPVWQYILMVIAGIPLLEIGLSLGGSMGLQLSRTRNRLHSMTELLTSRTLRWIGYIPITLFGLVSFSTNATLTIQQFGSIPALTWFLLPSATLGIDLINIVSGIALWNEILTAVSTKINKDKALFLYYTQFLEHLPEAANAVSVEDIAGLFLNLEQETQQKIIRLIPDMQDKDVTGFVHELTDALQKNVAEQNEQRTEALRMLPPSAERKSIKYNCLS